MCSHTEWYDARYRVCRKTTKAVWRQCLFSQKCNNIKYAYCQALGPREAGCACDNGYVYRKAILPGAPLDENGLPKVQGKCARDFTTTVFQTESTDFGKFGKGSASRKHSLIQE